VKLLDRRLTPLRDRTEADLRFTVFRENTEDLYAGVGGTFKRGTEDEIAIEESISTRKGVTRIIEAAFQYATSRGETKVTMADKGNALRYSGDLWARTFDEVGRRHPGIEREHLYVDALALELVLHPGRFRVIVTANLFGDILTDLAAALQGGLGVAPSGNIHPGRVSMFEPVHGSAPDLAGRGCANPVGAILSAAMLLEHAGWSAEASAVERSVASCVRAGRSTRDLGGRLGTREVGDAVVEALDLAWAHPKH
jgi:3-isopropylmalate dehydrogenase